MTDHIIHSASTGSTDRWDNEGGQMPPDNDLQHELELYGIANGAAPSDETSP